MTPRQGIDEEVAMEHRILLAVHDSDTSRRTARAVRDLFPSAEILAIDVADRPLQWIAPGIGYGVVFPAFPALGDDGHDVREVEVRRGAREQAAQVMDDSGVEDVRTIGAMGDPVTAILNAAKDHDVDAIAVGGDGGGLLDRLLDRSVARALLDDADRPVLVVPPA
jgi:nucleotide-binding universal stress UspA family protein